MKIKETIKSQLRTRTTEQLKQDTLTAYNSMDESATIIFCFALDVLEERLTPESYTEFENNVHQLAKKV